jgi:hypothetical protein
VKTAHVTIDLTKVLKRKRKQKRKRKRKRKRKQKRKRKRERKRKPGAKSTKNNSRRLDETSSTF